MPMHAVAAIVSWFGFLTVLFVAGYPVAKRILDRRDRKRDPNGDRHS